MSSRVGIEREPLFPSASREKPVKDKTDRKMEEIFRGEPLSRGDLFVAAAEEQDSCGFCKKPGGNVFWYTPVSKRVHEDCYKTIKTVSSEVTKKINALFPKESNKGEQQSEANYRAMEAVIKHIPSQVSLSNYHDYHVQKKQPSLKDLFDTVGVAAVETYAKQKQ